VKPSDTRTTAALVLIGTVFAMLGIAPDRGSVATAMTCGRALEVDGTLLCDAETRRVTDVVDANSGDRIVNGVVVGRMNPHAIAALELPVDLNTASEAELDTLPRIGPVLAARIIEHRPYESVQAITRVRGVGPKTLARIRHRALTRDPSRRWTPRRPPTLDTPR